MKSIGEALDLISTPIRQKLSCDKHGSYSGWVVVVGDAQINSICDTCAEEEAERNRQAFYAENRANAERVAAEGRRNAINSACIPPIFKNKSFKDFAVSCKEMDEVKKRMARFIINFEEERKNGTSFLFSGQSGTGKTHLATAVANNLIQKGFSAVYVSSLNYLSKVKISWNQSSNTSEDEIIEHYVSFDVLIFDELKGTYDSKEKAMIFRLISRRHEEGKTTIGITTLSEKRLVGVIDEDAVRRLKTVGGVIQFSWQPFQD